MYDLCVHNFVEEQLPSDISKSEGNVTYCGSYNSL